ncbi:polysaccharide deacetylase family protein [Salinactinospora qingdaonensis]|uniref:NodB homology domain-containing protein n=1 Tax=Salinactinospora qingdaonensis TaxID=702744 RepID=A0ABP7GFJ7_9ACTN
MFSSTTGHRLLGTGATATALTCLAACAYLPNFEDLQPNPPDTQTELVSLAPEQVRGVETRELVIEHEGVRTAARYPLIPTAAPLTMEIRTLMAERETQLITSGTGGELEQEATLLAVSDAVVGARIVARGGTAGTTTATTRWYDTASATVRPWRALLRNEAAITALGARVARQLRDDYGVSAEELPEDLREAATVMASPSNDSFAPPAAAEKQQRASSLHDIGFDTAGNVVIRFSPGQAGTGSVPVDQITVERATSDKLLSELGRQAREAAMNGSGTADLSTDTVAAAGPAMATLDCDRVPCVALTFDDGPGPHTQRLLDHLAEHSVDATFYVLGQLVDGNGETLRRAVREGHEIGNHSWQHDDLTTLSPEQVRNDLERTSAAIERAVGAPPRTMRPPYGAYDATSSANTALPMIIWDVDTRDWQTRSTAETVEIATSQTSPGSVVLMHDIHAPTVAAVPEIITRLRGQGYHFVTVSGLFSETGLKPGAAYKRRT